PAYPVSSIKDRDPITARNVWFARSSWNCEPTNAKPTSATTMIAPTMRDWELWLAARRTLESPTASHAIELLARAEEPPWADHEHHDQDHERHHVRQQRVDVLDRSHLRQGDDQGPQNRAGQAVEAADQR